MAYRKLSLVRGNTRNYCLRFKDKSGNYYALEDWKTYFTVKTNLDLPDSEAAIQKIITDYTHSTSGGYDLMTIALNAVDTANLTAGIYDFDIKVVTAANENFTLMSGKFEILPDVTRTVGTAGTA